MAKQSFHIIEKLLRSEATEAEQKAAQQWLKEGSFSEEADEHYRQKWLEAEHATVDEALRLEMLENLRAQIAPAQTQRRRTIPFRQIYQSVAAVLLPVVLAFSIYQMYNSSLGTRRSKSPSIVSVENGQKARMTLPDGTKVWINSGSTLKYDNLYNQSERMISLDGEAYFEVAKDKTRPFIVHTSRMDIQAVGTAFDVKAYTSENSITATLIEGKVKVSGDKFETNLLPNEKVVYDKLTATYKHISVENASFSCIWKNNKLAFEDETLGEIAVILERNYNVDIEFESEKIKNIRFFGVIKNNSLQSVLQLIALASPVNYSLENSKIIFRPDRKE